MLHFLIRQSWILSQIPQTQLSLSAVTQHLQEPAFERSAGPNLGQDCNMGGGGAPASPPAPAPIS